AASRQGGWLTANQNSSILDRRREGHMTDLPAHQFLDKHAIPYEKYDFPPETPKGAANVARSLGCRESQVVKTLIFVTDTGEKVLVMLAADRNAISSHLKKAIGSRNIK